MDPKAELATTCKDLITSATTCAATSFGTTLPKEPMPIAFMVPSGPGSHEGKQIVKSVFNFYGFFRAIDAVVKETPAWKKAKELIEKIIELKGHVKPSPWDDVEHYLQGFLLSYFQRVDKIAFDSVTAEQEIAAFLQFLISDSYEFVGLMSLERFWPGAHSKGRPCAGPEVGRS